METANIFRTLINYLRNILVIFTLLFIFIFLVSATAIQDPGCKIISIKPQSYTYLKTREVEEEINFTIEILYFDLKGLDNRSMYTQFIISSINRHTDENIRIIETNIQKRCFGICYVIITGELTPNDIYDNYIAIAMNIVSTDLEKDLSYVVCEEEVSNYIIDYYD